MYIQHVHIADFSGCVQVEGNAISTGWWADCKPFGVRISNISRATCRKNKKETYERSM